MRWLGELGQMDINQRLREMGIELPIPMAPVGNYLPVVVVGDLVFVSGAGPVRGRESGHWQGGRRWARPRGGPALRPADPRGAARRAGGPRPGASCGQALRDGQLPAGV